MSGGARRVLVTGASAGIGRACADELNAAGWAVTGASRRGTTSGGWAGLVMDVDDDDSVRTGVAGLLAKRLLPFRAFEAAAKISLGV
jgi:NAD(P)-dependent dehydrogenase (short-subunit alcohol dehydrogenase family)